MLQKLLKLSKQLNKMKIKSSSLEGLISYAISTTEVSGNIVQRLSENLDTLNEHELKLFEEKLKELGNDNSFVWKKYLFPVFRKYPEYLNLNILDPFKLLFNIVYDMQKAQPEDLQLISPELLLEAWTKLNKKEKREICGEFCQELDSLPKFYQFYPSLVDLIYYYIVEELPSFYYVFKLDNYFKKDKWGEGYPEVDEEQVVEQLLKNPIEFLSAGLGIKYPALEKQAVEGLLQTINGLRYFFEKNYFEKYPFIEGPARLKLLNQYTAEIFSMSKEFLGSDYGSKLQGQAAYKLVEGSNDYQEDTEYLNLFFTKGLHKKFPDLGRQAAEKVFSQGYNHIKHFYGLDDKYPELSKKYSD